MTGLPCVCKSYTLMPAAGTSAGDSFVVGVTLNRLSLSGCGNDAAVVEVAFPFNAYNGTRCIWF